MRPLSCLISTGLLAASLALLPGCASLVNRRTAPAYPATPLGVYPLLKARGPIPTEALRKGEQRADLRD